MSNLNLSQVEHFFSVLTGATWKASVGVPLAKVVCSDGQEFSAISLQLEALNNMP